MSSRKPNLSFELSIVQRIRVEAASFLTYKDMGSSKPMVSDGARACIRHGSDVLLGYPEEKTMFFRCPHCRRPHGAMWCPYTDKPFKAEALPVEMLDSMNPGRSRGSR